MHTPHSLSQPAPACCSATYVRDTHIHLASAGFRDGGIRLIRNEVLHIAEDALREDWLQQESYDLRLVQHVQLGKRVV
jgi:hypothetical protein